ncbi:hypothetical protein [Herbidospora mongoliensis]|uniref:hypothetical protein n=1 Tax=Herbidospora mongoliensis TaxID=688067 RepID=UPI00082BFD06|nr:hypothetical protein [Herbidospora mongoliensis]
MITAQGERLFSAQDAGALFSPGVVTGGAKRRVSYEEHDPVVAVRLALGLARRSWVEAVAVAPAGVVLAHTGLALAFSGHLSTVRGRRGGEAACVTSPVRPPLPKPRLLRIPHLVTAAGPDGSWGDVVVWEVMTREQFSSWLDHGPPIDLGGVEARVPQLIALRRAAREGTLPDTPAVRALHELLRTRYWSIRLVLQHQDLFDSLLSPKETHP